MQDRGRGAGGEGMRQNAVGITNTCRQSILNDTPFAMSPDRSLVIDENRATDRNACDRITPSNNPYSGEILIGLGMR